MGAEEQSLLNRASGALAWSFLNTLVSRFGTLGIGIALARLVVEPATTKATFR